MAVFSAFPFFEMLDIFECQKASKHMKQTFEFGFQGDLIVALSCHLFQVVPVVKRFQHIEASKSQQKGKTRKAYHRLTLAAIAFYFVQGSIWRGSGARAGEGLLPGATWPHACQLLTPIRCDFGLGQHLCEE